MGKKKVHSAEALLLNLGRLPHQCLKHPTAPDYRLVTNDIPETGALQISRFNCIHNIQAMAHQINLLNAARCRTESKTDGKMPMKTRYYIVNPSFDAREVAILMAIARFSKCVEVTCYYKRISLSVQHGVYHLPQNPWLHDHQTSMTEEKNLEQEWFSRILTCYRCLGPPSDTSNGRWVQSWACRTILLSPEQNAQLSPCHSVDKMSSHRDGTEWLKSASGRSWCIQISKWQHRNKSRLLKPTQTYEMGVLFGIIQRFYIFSYLQPTPAISRESEHRMGQYFSFVTSYFSRPDKTQLKTWLHTEAFKIEVELLNLKSVQHFIAELMIIRFEPSSQIQTLLY